MNDFMVAYTEDAKYADILCNCINKQYSNSGTATVDNSTYKDKITVVFHSVHVTGMEWISLMIDVTITAARCFKEYNLTKGN